MPSGLELSNQAKLALFWAFISLGAVIKSSLLLDAKVSAENFIRGGLMLYAEVGSGDQSLKRRDVEDQFVILSISKTISELLSGSTSNRLIYKDATASALQIFTALLGSGSGGHNLVNLGCDFVWYDPYSHILNLFLKNFNYSRKFFNRKSVKKTIMTINYSATRWRCLKNFLSLVEVSSNQLPEVVSQFNNFFTFLLKVIPDLFDWSPTPEGLVEQYSVNLENCAELKLKTSDTSVATLHYFDTAPHRLDVIWRGSRLTLTDVRRSTTINMRKTKRALKANIAHTADATILRNILTNHPGSIVAIHDSFGCSPYEITTLIKNTQIAYRLLHLKQQNPKTKIPTNNHLNPQTPFILL